MIDIHPLIILHLIGIVLLLLVKPRYAQRSSSIDRRSTFSVLIAARNEEHTIASVLADIEGQGFEQIIVVDDNSSDRTASVAHAYGATVLFLENEQGKKPALLKGISVIESDYIVQLDADVRISKNYLKTLRVHIQDKPDMLVLPIVLPERKSLLEEVQRHEQAALLAISASLRKPLLANGANMVYRKNTFEAINGFDGNMKFFSGDDHFLMNKMLRANRLVKTVIDKELIAEVMPVTTMKAFFSQRIRWAGKLWHDRSLLQAFVIILAAWVLVTPFFYTSSWIYAGIGLGPVSLTVVLTILWFGVQYLMLVRVNRLLGRKSPLFSSVLASILFPLYAGIVLNVSIFVRPLWKGRKI